MKILSLHVDYINFKPLKKALKSIEDLDEKEKVSKEIEDALVILTAVEKGDEDVVKVVSELVKEIENIAKQVNAKRIVLYPYAHLSKDLASPQKAIEILSEAEKELTKKKYEVTRAPFGYYKEFELKVKGHPLSELSREIRTDVNSVEGISKDSKGKEEKRKEIKTETDKEIENYDYKQGLRSISKSVLDRSKLKDNDHRIIGMEMDLFSFNEVAPGMVFMHNNGLIIYNELIKFWRETQKKQGYQEISTPQILDKKLWLISGHWQKYKENIFLTEYEDRAFAVKPMNCPGGMLIYKNKVHSYKELPIRAAELGIVHRQELSGVLAGLFRVIKFTQDDAHIFCTEEQLEKEIMNIIELIDYTYSKIFNFPYHVELSTRPEKRIGSEAIWDKAEAALESVLKKNKITYKINKGDGAFYGPKIDFHIQDSLKRTWQCATIQLDFAMPERFDLTYRDENSKDQRPVMLHRVVYGSLERFMGILLEHYKGRLPTWLAPVQCRVLSFTDRNQKAAEKVLKQLQEQIPELRIDSDFSQTTMQSKVKEAEILRVPYILTIGDREEKENTVAVRAKGNSKLETLKVNDFIEILKKEINERK